MIPKEKLEELYTKVNNALIESEVDLLGDNAILLLPTEAENIPGATLLCFGKNCSIPDIRQASNVVLLCLCEGGVPGIDFIGGVAEIIAGLLIHKTQAIIKAIKEQNQNPGGVA